MNELVKANINRYGLCVHVSKENKHTVTHRTIVNNYELYIWRKQICMPTSLYYLYYIYCERHVEFTMAF